MTVAEAKEKITAEFIGKFYKWLHDLNELSEKEYWDEGYNIRPLKAMKDNQKSLIYFQSSIFSGRWITKWKQLGYDNDILLKLEAEGFLSHQHYWNRYKHPDTDFFYISQQTAKEIYKANKTA